MVLIKLGPKENIFGSDFGPKGGRKRVTDGFLKKSERVGAKGVSAWKGSPHLGSPRSLSGLVCVLIHGLKTFFGCDFPCFVMARQL